MTKVLIVFGVISLVLVIFGVLVASSLPDGLESVAETLGFAERADEGGFAGVFAHYETSFIGNSWLSKVAAGLVGLAIMAGLCVVLGRSLRRREH